MLDKIIVDPVRERKCKRWANLTETPLARKSRRVGTSILLFLSSPSNSFIPLRTRHGRFSQSEDDSSLCVFRNCHVSLYDLHYTSLGPRSVERTYRLQFTSQEPSMGVMKD